MVELLHNLAQNYKDSATFEHKDTVTVLSENKLQKCGSNHRQLSTKIMLMLKKTSVKVLLSHLIEKSDSTYV